MSTILKALRKVEGERKKDVDARRHHAEVTSTGPGAGSPFAGRSRIVAVAGAGLILAAAGLAWSWLRPADDLLIETAPAMRTASSPPAAAPPPREAPALVRERRAAPARVAAVDRKLPPLDPPVPSAPPAPTEASPSRAVPDLAEATVEAAELSASGPGEARKAPPTMASLPEALREASVRPGPPPSSRLVDESAAKNPASLNPAPLKPASLNPAPLNPALRNPPPQAPAPGTQVAKAQAPRTPAPRPETQAVVKAVPVADPVRWPQASPAPAPPAPVVLEIRVLRTVWHPVVEKRIAYVAASAGPPVELHQGEAFQGFEVSEIGLSSVVFEADGQRLTRSVGASE